MHFHKCELNDVTVCDPFTSPRVAFGFGASGFLLIVFVEQLVMFQHYEVFFALAIIFALWLIIWMIMGEEWSMEDILPVIWCWAPLGLFYGKHSFWKLDEEPFAYEAKIGLYVLNFVHLLMPLLHKKRCILCVSPLYILGLIEFLFPESPQEIGQFIVGIFIFVDTIYHYISSHLLQVAVRNFTRANTTFLLLTLLIVGMYPFLLEFYGVFTSLMIGMFIDNTLQLNFSTLVDPDSVVGMQLVFITGQVCVGLFFKLFQNYNHSILWSALRGLITGRVLLIYVIRDEIQSKKVVGRSKVPFEVEPYK